jgi:uncharacterized protein
LKRILVFLAIALPWYSQAQNKTDLYNHKTYVEILGHSKDSIYTKILSEYDQFIGLHRLDYKVPLERCKFIEYAYYDYSEEYNPKYEETETCKKELVLRFPNTPEVLLYKAEGIYGDSALIFLKTLEDKINDDPVAWSSHSWKVYELLANSFSIENDNTQAIWYAEQAMKKNDTLDLSLLLGRLYKDTSPKKAIALLTKKLDSTQQSWELNQKGKLLLELGAPDKAILAYKYAKKDSTGWQDSGSLAQAFIDNGFILEARSYLLKETANTWKNTIALYKLFDYDVKYSSADSAKATYRRLVKDNFWNDPIGMARVRLFFKAPMAAITIQDIGRIGLLLLSCVLFFIIPYLWILPIHYVSTYFKKNETIQDATSFRWGLSHLWIAFSLWLFVDYAVLACFNYPSIIALFNDSVVEDVIPPISYLTAKMTLFFFIGMSLSTLGFLKAADVRGLWLKIKNQSQRIWVGVGICLLLRFSLGIYLVVLKKLGWLEAGDSLSVLSINDDILSINQFYHPLVGFLFVVIIVPIYEEILFRGVFLSACQKHINFLVANLLQAFVFALAHQNLKLFIFYFAFGFIAGRYRHRTQSLATGLSLHISNNLIAFLAIIATQKVVG